jgi:hypothetical protein
VSIFAAVSCQAFPVCAAEAPHPCRVLPRSCALRRISSLLFPAQTLLDSCQGLQLEKNKMKHAWMSIALAMLGTVGCKYDNGPVVEPGPIATGGTSVSTNGGVVTTTGTGAVGGSTSTSPGVGTAGTGSSTLGTDQSGAAGSTSAASSGISSGVSGTTGSSLPASSTPGTPSTP